MNTVSKMKGLPMSMTHPTLGCPTVAEIVEKWYESGRWTGYKLQFAGEKTTRNLRFGEIRKLQGQEES